VTYLDRRLAAVVFTIEAYGRQSCLMHQQGCGERIGIPIKFIHIAQSLNGADA
jgi:L-lactate dehydrogenase complex protein LldE